MASFIKEGSMQKASIGGILSIVAGAFGIIAGLILLVVAVFTQSIFNDPAFFGSSGYYPEEFVTFIGAFYGILAFFEIALGVLGIVGGIFAIQRKHWGWALAAAISGVLTFMPVGVAAVVFIAIGKPEFGQIPPAPPSPPQPQM